MLDIKKIREMMLLSSATVWGITSIRKGTGKSYVSKLLVDAFTEIGKNILYISLGEEVLSDNSYVLSDIDEAIEIFEKEKQIRQICISKLEKIESVILNEKFEKLLDVCKKNYDYIIVDTKSIEETGFAKMACRICDENIVVILKNKEDGVTSGKYIHQLQKLGIKVFGVILNEYFTKKPVLRM